MSQLKSNSLFLAILFLTILGCDNNNSLKEISFIKVDINTDRNIKNKDIYFSNGKIKERCMFFNNDTLGYVKYDINGNIEKEFISIDIKPKKDTIFTGKNI